MNELRDGRTVEDPRLDRIPEYDEKSRGWQVRRLLETLDRTFGKAWRPTPNLNQRNFGACVWYSLATILNSSPIRRKPKMTEQEALENYFETQRNDEFAGGEYPGANPVSGGTSLIAGLRLAQALGLVDSYYWAGAGSGTAIDDVIDAARRLGSLQFGVPWYRSMLRTEPGGTLVVDPSSGIAGYHAIDGLAFRYAPLPGHGTKKVEHMVWPNTWGPSWGGKWYGIGGHAFVRIEDIERYLLPRSVWGECAVVIEKPLG